MQQIARRERSLRECVVCDHFRVLSSGFCSLCEKQTMPALDSAQRTEAADIAAPACGSAEKHKSAVRRKRVKRDYGTVKTRKPRTKKRARKDTATTEATMTD